MFVIKLDSDLAQRLRDHLEVSSSWSEGALPESLVAELGRVGAKTLTPLFPEGASDRALRDLLTVRAREGLPVDPHAELPHLDAIFRVTIDPTSSPTRAAAALGGVEGVVYAEALFEGEPAQVVPPDQEWPNQWGPARIRADFAWLSHRGAQQLVAVLDSGLVAHDDLDIVGHIDACAAGGPAPSPALDLTGHGTRVAGVIGAGLGLGPTAGNGGVVGVAPEARLLDLRVFDPATNNPRVDCVAAALGHLVGLATQNPLDPAPIANASIALHASSLLLEDAVRAAHLVGIPVVSAAGNDTLPMATTAPANIEHGLAVTAVGPTSQPSSFSNFGVKADVAAPGGVGTLPCTAANCVRTTAASPQPSCVGTMTDCHIADGLGTSFAAPHVAAVAALLRERAPDWNVEQLRSAIRLGADDANAPTAPGFDVDLGHGVVDAESSLRVAPIDVPPPTANITRPMNGNGLRGKTAIRGYAEVAAGVAAPGLGHYELAWGPTLQGPYTTIATAALNGLSGHPEATLAMVSPSTFGPPGTYFLRLTTTDTLHQASAVDYQEIEVCGGCAPLPPGAVAWWRFERSTPLGATDSVGANHGVYLGNASPGALGRVGDGAGFFAEAQDLVSAPAVQPPSFYTMTVMAWVRANSFDPGVIASYSADGLHGWELTGSGSGLGFVYNAVGGVAQTTGAALVPMHRRWTHVAVVLEPQLPGVLAPMRLKVFVNGALTTTTHFTLPSSWHPTPVGPTYRIGGGPGFATQDPFGVTLPARPFGGQLDEVVVYGKALTAQQVQAVYAARCGGICQ